MGHLNFRLTVKDFTILSIVMNMVGDNAAIGAAVIILPGRYVPNNSVIQAGTIYCKNEAVTRN